MSSVEQSAELQELGGDSEYSEDISEMLEGAEGSEFNRTLADALIEGKGLDAEYNTTGYVAKGSVNTVYASDDAALGLRTLGEINGYFDNMDRMFMGDMVTAKDPNRAGKRLLDYLKKAGQNPEYDEIPDETRLRNFLDEVTDRDDLPVLEEHEEELQGLLNSKSDREENARRYLDEMLPDDELELNYVTGEAADFNLKEEREKHLKRFARRASEKLEEIKKEKGELAKELSADEEYEIEEDKLTDAIEELGQYFEDMSNEYDSAVEKLNKIHNIGFNHIRSNEEHGNDFNVEDYLEEHDNFDLDDLDRELNDEYANEIRDFLSQDFSSAEEFREEYEELKQDWFGTLEAVDSDLVNYEAKLEDLDDTLDKLGLEADNPEFASWMGHISGVTNLDARILTYFAEDDIKDHVYKSFPEKNRDDLEEVSTGKITTFEHEEYGDVAVVDNQMWSNVSSEYSMMRLKDDLLQKWEKENGDLEDLPDTVMTFHAAGGLESMLLNIAPNNRETGEEDEWLRDPEYNDLEEYTKDVRFLNLPKFMSIDKVQDQFEAGSGDDEAKNWYKSWMQTGMVFQHDISVDTEEYGEMRLEMIEHVPEKFLTKIGEKTRKMLDAEDEEEREARMEDIKDYLADPESYEEGIERDYAPEKLILDIGDEHIGVPSFKEPTNRQKINAWTKAIVDFYGGESVDEEFEIETGFIYGGDLFDGDVSWGGETESDGESATKVRKYIENDLKELIELEGPELDYNPLDKFEELDLKNLEEEPDEKKHEVIQQAYEDEELMLEDLDRLSDINEKVMEAYEEAVMRWTQNADKYPLPNTAKQADVAKNQIMELERAIGPGFRINVSGNHTNDQLGDQEINMLRNAQDLAWDPTEDPTRNKPKRFNLDSMGAYAGGHGYTEPFEDSDLGIFTQHYDKGGTHPMKLSRDLSIAQNTGADVEVRHHDHFPGFNIVHGKVIWGPGSTLSSTIRGEVSGYGHNSWPQEAVMVKGSSNGDSRGWAAEVSVPHETLIEYVDGEEDLGFEELEEEFGDFDVSQYLSDRKQVVDSREELRNEISN